MYPWPIVGVQQATLVAPTALAKTFAQAFGSNTTTGNFLAIVFSSQTGGTVTVADNINGSWTNALATAASDSNSFNIFYVPNITGGATTVTVTNTANDIAAGEIYEFSGVSTSSPLDAATNTSSQSSYVTSSTITATAPYNQWTTSATSSELLLVGMMANNTQTPVVIDNPNNYPGFITQNASNQTGFSGGVCSSAYYLSNTGNYPLISFAFDPSSVSTAVINNVYALFTAQGSSLVYPQVSINTLGIG